MRGAWTIVGIVALLLLVGAAGAEAGGASGKRCARALPQASPRLPAPIVVTTSCGRFRLQPTGDVVYKGRRTSPVPRGASYWPQDLTWYRFARGHLLIGRGPRQLWRSHDTYPYTYPASVGRVALGRRGLAFSYYRRLNRTQRLYVARYGGRERAVARGEDPLTFLDSGGLVTWRGGHELVLRTGRGRFERVIAPHATDPQWDPRSRLLLFRLGDHLRVFDGRRVRELARLRELGIKGWPDIAPLGRFVAVHDRRRLVVVDYGGRLIASAVLPKWQERADGVSSSVVANADGSAVAFTATWGNTAYGSRGRETVYVLGVGGTQARPVFSQQVDFNVCERMAWLAWQGRWLLYGDTEQQGAVVDSSGAAAPVDLGNVIAQLPGIRSGADGAFDIAWA